MEEYIQLIYAAVIAALPSIVSVIGVVISVAKMLSKVNGLQKTCDHEAVIKALQDQIIAEHKDNEELRAEIQRLTEVISHVKQN